MVDYFHVEGVTDLPTIKRHAIAKVKAGESVRVHSHKANKGCTEECEALTLIVNTFLEIK